jgi:ribosomal protein S27AE
MKRITDEPYGTFGVFSVAHPELSVCCPKCGGLAQILRDGEAHRLECGRCGHRESKSHVERSYRVGEICAVCERWFHIKITDEKQIHQTMLNVRCPHCGNLQPGNVIAKETSNRIHWQDVVRADGVELIFGYPLYYRAGFGNEVVWAVNRAHLAYLIAYIDADLREVKEESYMDFCGTATESDRLPKFMKSAKNHGRLVKALHKLQLRAD